MPSSRPLLLLSFAALCWGANVSAQTVPMQSPPITQPRVQQPPIQQPQIQTQPMQPSQFGTQGTPSVYQTQPAAQPANPQVPMGTNMQPIRTATNNPTVPTATGQPISLYNPSEPNRVPQVVQPGTTPGATQPPPGMMHVGRAEPANRIIPFFPTPAEQQELDIFLARWEKHSAGIKRYDVEFNMFEYDLAVEGALPNVPLRRTFGYFKYIATPMRFLFEIEGEWRGTEKVKWDEKKNPHIYAEKVIIEDKAVYKYDYNAKTVHQITIPPEMIGRGIADSPLPLIFGAKADDLKRRFSMKVVTDQNGIIRLYARPLLIEDQQEFKELEIMLKSDLTAIGLRQFDINDKKHKAYELKSPKTNHLVNKIIEDIGGIFKPTIEKGWKHEVTAWVLQPAPAPGMPPMPVANPYPPQPPPKNGTPLYQR